MSRKGENIRKRKDGRWEARYAKGRRADGSIQYGYVYSQKYSDVKKKQQGALALLERAEHFEYNKFEQVSFKQFADEWKENIRYSIKISSFCFYNTILERHLYPCFGETHLVNIDSEMVQKFINQKASENYSVAYIRSMINLLQNILKNARLHRHINISHIYVQTPSKKKCIPKGFKLCEWKILESYLLQKGDMFSFGLLLCMYTGIRIGELSGLKWSDFDTETGQICIRRTVYRIKNLSSDNTINSPKTILNIGPPKTPSSIREIPLPLSLIELLLKQKKGAECFVLTGTSRCMEPRTIQKRYRKVLEECHIPYLNFHSLRHSFATMGIQKGFDYKSLSEILGHSSVTTTLNIYVHSDINRKRQCMELFWS